MIIIFNTTTLAIEYPDMDSALSKTLDVLNYVFTSVFVVETAIKMVGYGIKGYFNDTWNRFDFVIVMVSVAEIIIVQMSTSNSVGGLSVLRAFRIFRILRLAKRWVTMQRLIKVIGTSLSDLGNITFLLGVFVFTFAVLGKQFFQETYTLETFPNGIPRWNFSDFEHSFLLVFRIMCGEWVEPLWETLEGDMGYMPVLYYLPYVAIVNFIILNLFVALLINSFDDETSMPPNENALDVDDDEHSLVLPSTEKNTFEARSTQLKSQMSPPISDSSSTVAASEPKDLFNETLHASKCFEFRLTRPTGIPSRTFGDSAFAVNSSPIQQEDDLLPTNSFSTFVGRSSSYIAAKKETIGQTFDDERIGLNKGTYASSQPRSSLALSLRRGGAQIIEHRLFEPIILTLILASSVALALEDIHLRDRPNLAEALDYLNVFFAAIFVYEFLVKCLGIGVFAYFKSGWNAFDFLLVVTSCIALIETGSEASSSLIGLRTLRALRPLRAVSRWEGMKVVVDALFRSIPGIANVLLVCVLVWLIFAIMGVQFFGGKFWKCTLDGQTLPAEVVYDKTACIAGAGLNYVWENPNINFDNIGYALLALFQVATFEGWMEVIHDAVDISGPDLQPSFESSFESYYFFVLFIIIGSFFILNLFVGVIIDNFSALKVEYESEGLVGGLFLTTKQRKHFKDLSKLVKKLPPPAAPIPETFWRLKFFNLTNSEAFEKFMLTVILCNLVTLCVDHWNEAQVFVDFSLYANICFTIIYFFEVVVKLIGLSTWYFKSNWNIFDFLVVIVSIVGIVLELQLNRSVGSETSGFVGIIKTMKVLRVGKLFRHSSKFEGIRILLGTIVLSLPSLMNIGMLLLVVVFIFAIIGMALFKNLMHNGAITQTNNFETFSNALLVLFRLNTSAGWNDIVAACSLEPSGSPDSCVNEFFGENYGNCGSRGAAQAFFACYTLVSFLIIVNMYVAVILENLEEANHDQSPLLHADGFEDFYKMWLRIDQESTRYIPAARLVELLEGIKGKLGFDSGYFAAHPRVLKGLAIPIHNIPSKQTNIGTEINEKWTSAPNMPVTREFATAQDFSEFDLNKSQDGSIQLVEFGVSYSEEEFVSCVEVIYALVKHSMLTMIEHTGTTNEHNLPQKLDDAIMSRFVKLFPPSKEKSKYEKKGEVQKIGKTMNDVARFLPKPSIRLGDAGF